MVTTNLVKWQDDGDDELTAYCSDDDTDTEVGPAKWDDTNNQLEINCNSVDAIVKWDDTGNNLESRTTDDGCCGIAMSDEDCDCYDEGQTPLYVSVTISGMSGSCGEYDCSSFNGTYILEHEIDGTNTCNWIYRDEAGWELTYVTWPFLGTEITLDLCFNWESYDYCLESGGGDNIFGACGGTGSCTFTVGV